MDLFSDLDLGSEGEFEELIAGKSGDQRSSAVIYRNALSGQDSDRLFNELLETVDWEQREVLVYGKRHLQPRLVAWFGDPGTSYTYAGLTLHPTSWIAPILEIKAVCEELSGNTFNSVLLNHYRDGNDTVGWHSDDESELGRNPIIASVSLGAMRRFDFRHKITNETVKVLLPSGSVLIMAGSTQSEWSHQVPRTKKVGDPRINLTFRKIQHV